MSFKDFVFKTSGNKTPSENPAPAPAANAPAPSPQGPVAPEATSPRGKA